MTLGDIDNTTRQGQLTLVLLGMVSALPPYAHMTPDEVLDAIVGYVDKLDAELVTH